MGRTRTAATDPADETTPPAAEPVDASQTEDHTRAADKRKAALATPDKDAGMIAALQEERRGYVIRGLKDRVAQVDESLAFYGYTGE